MVTVGASPLGSPPERRVEHTSPPEAPGWPSQVTTLSFLSHAEKPILPTSNVQSDNPADAEAVAEEEEAQAEADAAAEEAGEEEEENKTTITLSTAPIDPRFNTANASRYCTFCYLPATTVTTVPKISYFNCRLRGLQRGPPLLQRPRRGRP